MSLTEYRAEQLLARRIIDALLRENNQRVDSHLEYEVRDLLPVQGDRLNYFPKLDIAYFFNRHKVAIELSGGSHDGTRQQNKDSIRNAILTAHPNNWEIITLHHEYMPFLFKRAERKLDWNEFIIAYGEIYTKLKDRFNLKILLPDSTLRELFNSQ